MNVTITAIPHLHDDEYFLTFSFELIIQISGVSYRAVINEPYLDSLDHFRIFIDSVDKHKSFIIHFYQGYREGFMSTEDRETIEINAEFTDVQSSDIKQNIILPLAEYSTMVRDALCALLTKEVVERWENLDESPSSK